MTDTYPFQNTPLPYAYDSLEPYIDRKTMELHHDKHLQTYIDNLNNALADSKTLQGLSLEQLLLVANLLPSAMGTAIKNNAGGVYNHRFYFEGLSPEGNRVPVGSLADAIERTYGGFDAFQKRLQAAALSVFGSGYAWLVADPKGMLQIITTPNQDTPLPQNQCPILNVDVWEHAYYLKHYNRRADYLADWFPVVNWEKANERYQNCRRIL